MSRRYLTRSKILALGGAVFPLFGCGGGSGDVKIGMTADPLTTAAPAASTATDAAPPASTATDVGAAGSASADTGPQLEVTVSEVDVHVAANHDEGTRGDSQAAASAGGSGWTTIMSSPVRLNLFDAQTAEKLLDEAPVPAGKVTQVRLVLADDAALVSDTTSTPVACPSCTETGLKIVTEGSVEVANGETLHLTLDFDSAHSLTLDASGYRLAPVVRIARATKE